jgi:hypothetical protein
MFLFLDTNICHLVISGKVKQIFMVFLFLDFVENNFFWQKFVVPFQVHRKELLCMSASAFGYKQKKSTKWWL